MPSTFDPATYDLRGISKQIHSTTSWTPGTSNSTRYSSHTFKTGGPPTLSTDSHICSRPSYRASTQDGAIPNARTSTAYTSPTWRGAAIAAIATLHGPPYRPSLSNCAKHAQPLPSWPPIGSTNRGTKTSSDSHPKPYIYRQHGTCSSPAYSASPRGSGHPHGASWSF
jgi:hypothetical protein